MSTETTTADESCLDIDDGQPVAVITLNRPKQRNALSLSLMLELTNALDRLSKQPGTRSIVIHGAGSAFSSGHNLRELVGRTQEEEREIFNACAELMQTIQRIGQPVIAAVNGHAAAAGCQLVASCDLALAADHVTFSTPGVKIGLFCSTPMVALSRSIGRKRALEMLLTGRNVDAKTAAEWGLINRVVASEELLGEALKLAESVSQASPLTLAIGKQAFYQQIDLPQEKAYQQMSQTMAANAMTSDAQEGMTAFLEKRQPRWRGK